MLTEDRHLCACALAVEKHHNPDAPRFVAIRIGALALAGDVAGVERWKAIAAKMAVLARR